MISRSLSSLIVIAVYIATGKSNSRQLVWRGKRPAFIKSPKARRYVRKAVLQILPPARPFDQPVRLDATIFYASERPDLDESLIMDVLQAAGVVKNDRLIREKHIAHAIDRDRPRAEIRIEPRKK